MNRQFRYIRLGARPPSLLAQVLAFVVGVVVLGVSIIVGGILLAALLGFGLIIGVVLYFRLQWLRRKAAQSPDRVIETEYIVVSTSQEDDDEGSKDR